MISENNLIKMIFGFKVKYLRQEKKLSYQQLAQATGLSTSYLHDIEKGRKYPKVARITALAEAFGVTYDELVSMRASKKLQPVIDLLTSDFVKEFPLDLFGISTEKLFELFSNTPDKVNAFINTLIRLTRNYQMQKDNFYLAALRSYQDMYDNYFEELEKAVHEFRKACKLKAAPEVATTDLEQILKEQFAITINRKALKLSKALKGKRSYFSQKRKILFLNEGLSNAQENFLLGREIAFQHLQLENRPFLTRIPDVHSFEKLLNNFKASYFSVALLMNEHTLAKDLQAVVGQPRWHAKQFLALIDKYNVTPEMLLQRITNILPHHFGIKDIFFIRITGENDLKHYRMTKELHLSQPQSPYANELNEHYCRRWVSVNIIKNLYTRQQVDNHSDLIIDTQISSYLNTNNQYFCISIARGNAQFPDVPASVTIGLLLTDELRKTFTCLSDPGITIREVNTTCERCHLTDCEARIAPPTFIQQANLIKQQQEALNRLDNE